MSATDKLSSREQSGSMAGSTGVEAMAHRLRERLAAIGIIVGTDIAAGWLGDAVGPVLDVVLAMASDAPSRFDVPGWVHMSDQTRVDALTQREDALWLCEAGPDGDHSVIVRGWSSLVEHYARNCFVNDEPPSLISKRKAAERLSRNGEEWDFGSTCTANFRETLEDLWVSYTLVTDISPRLLLPMSPSAADVPRMHEADFGSAIHQHPGAAS